MQYKPGSKYKAQETSGNELVYKSNNKNYIGPYLEMSDNTYFSGNSITRLGGELIKTKLQTTSGSVLINNPNNIFSILKKQHYGFLDQTKSIPATKSFPTEKDYEKGKFKRYFTKRKNTKYGYLEINKKTYDSLKNKKPEYDWHLYTCGELIWGLQGQMHSINNRSLKIIERKFKGVSMLFPNLEEFYLPPVLQNKEKEFKTTKESHPESDKVAQTPQLQKVQNSMMRKVKEDYDKKQNKMATKLIRLKKAEQEEPIPTKFTGGGVSSGGGMSSGGGSGGGGGY